MSKTTLIGKYKAYGKVNYSKEITLKPNETKTLELVLRWNLKNNNIGTRKNLVTIDAKSDIDQMLIKEEKIELEKTNNTTYSEMITSVKTGLNIMIVIIVTLLASSIFAIGVYLIKKYVI